ncbi:MAG: hypothetical protein GX434_06790 [Peptococcaceae bacterium]|nr:hypothetical protein [Peptococcaceae bacterium]
MERFIRQLTGKNVRILVPEKVILQDPNNISLKLPDDRQFELSNQRQGWGLEYHFDETYSEEESMFFSAQGKIRTEDGKEIDRPK